MDFGHDVGSEATTRENIVEVELEAASEEEREMEPEVEPATEASSEGETTEGNRQSTRNKRPPVRYGLDEFVDTAQVTHMSYCVRFLS